jgi:hypothetical protein
MRRWGWPRLRLPFAEEERLLTMGFYAVRKIREKQLVGLFYSESLPHLIVELSRMADTERCEFAELGGGALFWPAANVEIPLRAELPLNQTRVTDSWRNALTDPTLEWMPLLTMADAGR